MAVPSTSSKAPAAQRSGNPQTAWIPPAHSDGERRLRTGSAHRGPVRKSTAPRGAGPLVGKVSGSRSRRARGMAAIVEWRRVCTHPARSRGFVVPAPAVGRARAMPARRPLDVQWALNRCFVGRALGSVEALEAVSRGVQMPPPKMGALSCVLAIVFERARGSERTILACRLAGLSPRVSSFWLSADPSPAMSRHAPRGSLSAGPWRRLSCPRGRRATARWNKQPCAQEVQIASRMPRRKIADRGEDDADRGDRDGAEPGF